MNILNIIIVLGVILFSMILHELSHGIVALWLGDMTAKEEGRLSLSPAKHLDPIMSLVVPVMLYMIGAPVFGGAKPVPINTRNLKFKEWGMAMVALAGPLMNFLLALVFFLVGHFTGWLWNGGVLQVVFSEFVLVNLGFMVFNLLPIPPLDGSRIVYAFAPDGVRSFMEGIERSGMIIVYALILFFGSFFSYIMSGAINGILEFFYWIVGM